MSYTYIYVHINIHTSVYFPIRAYYFSQNPENFPFLYEKRNHPKQVKAPGKFDVTLTLGTQEPPRGCQKPGTPNRMRGMRSDPVGCKTKIKCYIFRLNG